MLALVDPSDNVVRTALEEHIDLSADMKTGWRWLPIVDETTDTSTPGNEYVTTEPVVQTIEATRVLRTRTRRNMTTQETTARKDLVIGTMDQLQFEWLFDLENRMRAQEGVQAVTRAQVRTALRNRL